VTVYRHCQHFFSVEVTRNPVLQEPRCCSQIPHALRRELRTIVARKLIPNWSPEQISGWLKRRCPNNESMRVSHETIYGSLFIQARGVLKKELVQHLRSERLMRRFVHTRAGGKSHGQIVDAISIRRDLQKLKTVLFPVIGGRSARRHGNFHIATLVERQSRFTILVKVPSKDTETVVAALSRQVRKLPESLRRSLTWDRGLEMAKHKSFTVEAKVQVYFCDPQSPWQRGTNENTNGLLRQYFPKKTDLSGYSQADLDKVALQLNQRPRKTLGFETPADKLQASVASTH
jgi:IS30 family transposase